MSEHAATPQYEAPAIPSVRDSVRKLTGYWRLLLAAGIAWVAVALVILQFDQASVTTVGRARSTRRFIARPASRTSRWRGWTCRCAGPGRCSAAFF